MVYDEISIFPDWENGLAWDGSPVGTPLTENAIYLIDDVQMASDGPNISGVEFSARAGQFKFFGTGFTPEMAEFLNANPTDGISYAVDGADGTVLNLTADDFLPTSDSTAAWSYYEDSDGLDPPALKLQLNYGDNQFLLDDGSELPNLLSTGTGVADTITITNLVYNSDGDSLNYTGNVLAAFSDEEHEHEGETIEFLATVNSDNKYVFQDVGMSQQEGVPQYVGMEGMSTTPVGTPVLDFVPWNTYVFYQTDPTNYTHPLILSAAAEWSSDHPFELGVDDGVTITGSVSTDGSADGDRVLTFTVPEDATGTLLEDVSTLFYKCVNHIGMTGEAMYGHMEHFEVNPEDFDAEMWTINTDYLDAYAAGKGLDNTTPAVDIDDDESPDITEAAGELIQDILSNALVMELNDEDTSGMVDADAGTITLADGGFEVVLSGAVVTDVNAPDQTDPRQRNHWH